MLEVCVRSVQWMVMVWLFMRRSRIYSIYVGFKFIMVAV